MITLTGILRRLGPLGRKIAWDRAFREGAAFSGSRSSTIQHLVRKYGEGRSVVELACGDGSLAQSLSGTPFAAYLGLDVSEEAIRLANAHALPGQVFRVSQMEDWTPSEPFDLLVVEEAIYYLSATWQRRLFQRVWEVAPDARAIVTVHSGVKHRPSLDVCKESSKVVEELVEGDRVYLVLERPD